MKKIVYLSPLYFNEKSCLGGGERYPLSCARGVVEASGGGCSVEIISYDKKPNYHEIQPGVTLRLLPAGKKVVLGLVTTKFGTIENSDDLKRRISAATAFVPLENLCLSPQCGFASTHHGNAVSEDEQWRKLELVVKVAEEVWGDR